MKRTVDMLISEHRAVALCSSFALITLLLSLVIVGTMAAVLAGNLPSPDHPLNTVIGLLLGATLLLSLIAMVLATYFVIKKKGDLVDWGIFLAIIWLLPYIGISSYLGGSNLLRIMKGRHLRSV